MLSARRHLPISINRNHGYVEIVIAFGIVSMLAMFALSFTISSSLESKKIVRYLDRVEGFYSAELLAWHGLERELAGLSSGESSAIALVTPPDIADLLFEQYSAESGVALNARTTNEHASSRQIIRRQKAGGLTYKAIADSSCGYFKPLSGISGVKTCLSKTPKPPSKSFCMAAGEKPAVTAAKPVTIISTQAELLNMKSGGNYRLGNDITLKDEFSPIHGGSSGDPIQELVLDGAGYSIINMIVKAVVPQIPTGLFESIRESAIGNLKFDKAMLNGGQGSGTLAGAMGGKMCIENITVHDPSIMVTAMAPSVGGLLGGMGKLENQTSGDVVIRNVTIACPKNGSIKVTGIVSTIGGLAGGIVQDSSYKLELINCHNSCDVNGIQAGGLVGYAQNVRIERCSASGKVSSSKSFMGGLLGMAKSVTIVDSYALGDINTNTNAAVGGLVGDLTGGEIIRSYSTGKVDSLGPAGGLIGQTDKNEPPTITDSYWDTVTSGRSSSAGGVGKTTQELQLQSTFTNWDFEKVWVLPEGAYPRLKGE